MKKKICVVTGARSEYGLLKPLLQEIKTSSCFELQLIASAMHLSPEFGSTINEILKDKFIVDEKIEMLLSSDSTVGTIKSMGIGLISFADAYQRLQPDLVVILGDRFEALVAAQAALVAKIPIAHIHGGELSLGAFDDSIRHSITKMSHLHFTANEVYRKRVIQLGENPETVFTVGPMIASAIKQHCFLEREALEESLQIKLPKPLFLVTILPETVNSTSANDVIEELFAALTAFPDAVIVFTKGNADPGAREIDALVDAFCKEHHHRAKSFVHLGQLRYLSLMKLSTIVIGNSSSGIIEAPFLRIPTVNIGDRQIGRVRQQSIIDCAYDRIAIENAIRQACSLLHQSKTEAMEMIGEKECPAKSIVDKLQSINFSSLIQKKFYDLDINYA